MMERRAGIDNMIKENCAKKELQANAAQPLKCLDVVFMISLRSSAGFGHHLRLYNYLEWSSEILIIISSKWCQNMAVLQTKLRSTVGFVYKLPQGCMRD